MKIVIENDKKVSEYDTGVFETILVKDGIPIFFEYHFKRFLNALRRYLKVSLDSDDISILRSELMDSVKVGNYGWRFIHIDGIIFVSYRDIVDISNSKLAISKNIRNSLDCKYIYKTTDYEERLTDLSKVRKEGYLDNIYINDKGYITSTSVANIFFIKDNTIFTPPIEAGILNGVVRKVIGEGFNILEKNISLDELGDYDCSFITNSLIGLKRIDSIGNIIFKGNCAIWNDLCGYYEERILKEKEGKNSWIR